MERILAAAKDYPAHADKETLGQKSYALVMVMRHSGLRISDTLLLSPDKLDGNKLFLYMKKTGEPVSVWVPNVVVGALKALPPARNGRYFWSRSTNELESVRKAWGDVFKNIFRRAGPFSSKPHAHRFRHTFAAGLLQRGVPLDDVAILLGHSNSKVTAAHYARWIRARQDRLDAIVKEAWGEPEPKDQEFTVIEGGKPAAKPAKARHALGARQE
jgi:integrase